MSERDAQKQDRRKKQQLRMRCGQQRMVLDREDEVSLFESRTETTAACGGCDSTTSETSLPDTNKQAKDSVYTIQESQRVSRGDGSEADAPGVGGTVGKGDEG